MNPTVYGTRAYWITIRPAVFLLKVVRKPLIRRFVPKGLQMLAIKIAYCFYDQDWVKEDWRRLERMYEEEHGHTWQEYARWQNHLVDHPEGCVDSSCTICFSCCPTCLKEEGERSEYLHSIKTER